MVAVSVKEATLQFQIQKPHSKTGIFSKPFTFMVCLQILLLFKNSDWKYQQITAPLAYLHRRTLCNLRNHSGRYQHGLLPVTWAVSSHTLLPPWGAVMTTWEVVLLGFPGRLWRQPNPQNLRLEGNLNSPLPFWYEAEICKSKEWIYILKQMKRRYDTFFQQMLSSLNQAF